MSEDQLALHASPEASRERERGCVQKPKGTSGLSGGRWATGDGYGKSAVPHGGLFEVSGNAVA